MPSASGVYTLPSGYLAVTGQTIQASQHNPPLEDIAVALTNRLSRDGSAPMTGGLKAISGTAAIPGYTFATDASSGLFKTTNGVGVAIAGAQVAEFTAAGLASGVWFPGMMIPWTGAAAPNSAWVLPVGQTLSRATYPTLWTFAQAQIAIGNTFYNNGDGSTTFGIGDMRGRTVAAVDNMGGTTANRLTTGSMAGVRHTVGGAGGEDAHTLSLSELPGGINSNVSVSGTLTGGTGNVVTSVITDFLAGGGSPVLKPANTGSSASVSVSGALGGSATSNNTGGATHNNMQPTMLCTYILFAGGS